MPSNGIIRSFAFFALIVSAAFASCRRTGSEEAVPAPVTDPDDVRVSFRISLGATNGTRAGGTPEGAYDDGTGTAFENCIDLQNENYRFYFFDEHDKYLSAFQTVQLTPASDDTDRSKIYEVIGKTDRALPAKFKVVALANWPSYPGTPEEGRTTIEELCSAPTGQYAYDAPFILSPERLIPMYGVKTCEEMTFTPGVLTYLGTVHLLRAMAKIEVSCLTSGWTLESVTLRRYNAAGCCAPSGVYDQEDYVTGSYDTDYAKEIHLVGGRNDADLKTLAFQAAGENRFVVYVPEYRNVVAGTAARKADDAAEMRLRFKETGDKEYPVEFKYYNDPPVGNSVGDPFDIRRNYYYKFSITKTSEPDLAVEVFPYEQIELEPGFGILPKTEVRIR